MESHEVKTITEKDGRNIQKFKTHRTHIHNFVNSNTIDTTDEDNFTTEIAIAT